MSSLIVFDVVIMRGLSRFHLVSVCRAGLYREAYSLFRSSFRQGKCREGTFLLCRWHVMLGKSCWIWLLGNETKGRSAAVLHVAQQQPVVLGRSLFLRFAGMTVTPCSMWLTMAALHPQGERGLPGFHNRLCREREQYHELMVNETWV